MAKAAKRKTSAKKKSPARKTAKRKTPARKTAARKSPARKTARRKAPARRKAAPAKRYTATPSRATDKEHLVALVRDGTGCTIAQAKATLDGVFGTFDVRRRAARKGRNPQTGRAMRIKASRNVRFKVSKQIKSTL